MKRLFLLLAGVVLLSSCEKEPYCNEALQDQSPKPELRADAINDYRVTQEVAVERAIKAINSLTDRVKTRAINRRVANTQIVRNGVATRSVEAIDTLFYLINFEDNQGFALVAADERNTDVFMMAEEGSLDVDNLDPASPMNYFMDQATAFATYELTNSPRTLGDDIIDLDSTFIEPGTPRDYPLIEYDGVLYHCKVEHESHTVASYTTTAWHQDPPYNNKCFTEDGDRAAAGCVAIAMAQIMAYHQHPNTYDWDAMLVSSIVPSFYYAGVEAVSTLVADIGEAVDMQYGVDESSSSIGMAALGFMLSFDYAVGNVRNYDVNTVLNNIIMRQPVFIKGISQSDGGHAWVLDGVKYDIYERTYYDRETLLPVIHTETPPQNYMVRNNVGGNGCAPVWTISGIFEYYGYNYSLSLEIIDSVRPNRQAL